MKNKELIKILKTLPPEASIQLQLGPYNQLEVATYADEIDVVTEVNTTDLPQEEFSPDIRIVIKG